MWRLIYALVLAFAKADWPCPSTWPEKCWIMNADMEWGFRTCSETVTTDCWDCPLCNFGNEFGTSYDPAGNSIECGLDAPLNQVSFVSTTGYNCSLFQYDCDANFYDANFYDVNKYNADKKCVACKPRIDVYECDLAYFPKRCPLTSNVDRDGLCDECVFPALPPDTVGGAAVYRYGVGTLYPDCFLLKPTPSQENVFNITACANFQTPKWSSGWCTIECSVGFISLSVARFGVIGDLPKCRRCATACIPGTYPPVCEGGVTLGDGACLPCMVPLPLHAVWVRDCDWSPKPGYYTDGNGHCLPCLPTACDIGSVFMGCHDSSPGSCRPCEISCASSNYFIQSDMQMDQCSCVPCTLVTGTEYYSRNCSVNADAYTTACNSQCDPGFYIFKACSLFADLQCKPCSVVPNGRLLKFPCTAKADVDHGPCPAMYACDGSDTPFRCPLDRQLTPEGICGCLPAMEGPLCLPMTCPSGYYPDQISKRCLTCTQTDSVAALTKAGVMGLAACTCPPSYFFRPAGSTRIHCWPAGDLACDPRWQRQTPSLGLSSDEPSCVCGLGPGMQALDFTLVPSELCAATCEPGYTAVTAVDAALRDDFGFLLLLDSTAMPPVIRPRAFAVLGPDLLLLLAENGELQVLTPTATVAFPTINVFLTNFRLGDLRIHSVLAHESEVGFAWVLLSFWGYCKGYDDEGLCWVVQLIALQYSSMPTLATCLPSLMLCVTLKPSIDFQPTALAVKAIALGKASLLVAWNDTLVSRYSFGGTNVAVSNVMARGVAEAMNGVYTLLDSGELLDPGGLPMTYLPSSLLQVVAFPPGGHILLVQKADELWVQVDLWNRFVSPPLTAAAFQRQTLVLSNGTTISTVPCSIDAYSPHARECESLPCTLSLEACGPHSLRPFGTAECVCQPGYFWDQDKCTACVGSLYYCPGAGAPILCPAHSLASGTRASLSDCLCPPQWYHFETLCLPCPVGFFCPSSGTLFPVPCHAGGHTLDEGSSSPLQCLCPLRTHGLACEPCADSDDCAAAPVSQLVLLLLSPDDDLMRPCVGAASVFYPGLVVTTEVSMDCGVQYQVIDTATLKLQEPTPYGSRLEWDGKSSDSTCIAGYELLTITQAFGPQAHCFPCLNGTVRAQRAASSLCTACLDPNAHAPYLAMSACVCVLGYVFDATRNECVYTAATALYAPWWADSTVAIALPALAGFFALAALAYHSLSS